MLTWSLTNNRATTGGNVTTSRGQSACWIRMLAANSGKHVCTCIGVETREDDTSEVHENGSKPLSCVARLPLPCSPDPAWLEICCDTKRPNDGGGCERNAHSLHAPHAAYLQHPRQAGQRVKHARTLRRALHLQRAHASPQPHQSHNLEARLPPQQQHTAAVVPVCLAGLALHGKEPSARGALIFRIARPARCGAQMRPSIPAAFINPPALFNHITPIAVSCVGPRVYVHAPPASKRRRTRVARASEGATAAASCRRRSRRARDASPAPFVLLAGSRDAPGRVRRVSRVDVHGSTERKRPPFTPGTPSSPDGPVTRAAVAASDRWAVRRVPCCGTRRTSCRAARAAWRQRCGKWSADLGREGA